MNTRATRSRKTSKTTGRARKLKNAGQNRISEVVYETAKDLYAAGAIDKTTMRGFDLLRLPKVPQYTPNQIRAIRARCKASQQVFAAYMNISASSLQKWETGARKPDGVALKLLSLIDKKGLKALV
ncbi:MAG TPA: DNA-binding transcriptional regulator [Candidatus Obscuribacterales bacterium]